MSARSSPLTAGDADSCLDTRVSTADLWCEVRGWQSTLPDWGVSVPETGSDQTILNAPASSLGSKSAMPRF